MSNFLKKLTDKFQLFIYDSRHKVLMTFRFFTFLAAILSLGLLVHYYGYPKDQVSRLYQATFLYTFFIIFILNYLIRLFFSKERRSFLKNTALEGSLLAFLLLDGIIFYLFRNSLLELIMRAAGSESATFIATTLTHLIILLIIGLEVIKLSRSLLNFQVKPAILFIMSFLALIIFGTVLLMLPEMTVAEESIPVLDALFTATSATCVTGLIVVDTATYFTFKGHLVILILMQLGGIGIITFASFFAFYLKRGVGIKHQTAVQDFLSTESLYGTRTLLQQIIFYTFTIELLGCLAIFIFWTPDIPFAGLGEKIFFTVFHGVSAFCNAGFSLFSNGLYEGVLRGGFVLYATIAGLIILGGLGFPALKDIFGVKNVRERMQKPWKGWKTSTSVAVYASAALIAFGMIMFLLLERENVLQGTGPFEQAIHAFFQSVTARTAGFNTVDIAALTVPTYFLFIFLMFIGASSGSTGGGIKTSTFVVISSAVLATIRNKKQLELGRKTISRALVNRAFTIFAFAVCFIFLFTFLLTITEPDFTVMEIIFEEVSAFSTVGLTTGITPFLSDWGKVIIILSMYIGRVGTLTLAFALSSPVSTTAYKYPKTHLLIG